MRHTEQWYIDLATKLGRPGCWVTLAEILHAEAVEAR
jgi:hypothetical protein